MKNKKIAEAVQNGILTELEGKALDWLLSVGFYAEAGFSDVTFHDLAAGIGENVKTVKGIIGSLTKKGYTWTDNSPGEHIIYATIKGYKLDDNFETRWKPDIYWEE